MTNSVAVPVIEYRAITECGRILSHSSESSLSAIYEIKRDRFMTVSFIEPWTVWEARQPDNYEQPEHNHHLEVAIAS